MRWAIIGFAGILTACACANAEEPARPVIKKLGAIDCDMVETTPVVFQGKLFRFEYVRQDRYKPNTTGDSYFRFIDCATGGAAPSFGKGLHLGSAFVDGSAVYAFGVTGWGASRIEVLWSSDMQHWESGTALDLPGWEIFNTSVCKGPEGYVMAFEIGAPPEETGNGFTIRFAASKDCRTWRLTPSACVYTKDRYSACPSLRYLEGWYYMVYLEAYPGYWAPHIVRSKDLMSWESSPLNPIMKHSDEDRRPASPKLTPEECQRLATAKNVNNSDVDFCEFQGKTIIYYSWGDQQGTEHLAEAVYEGSEAAFLKAFFPSESGVK